MIETCPYCSSRRRSFASWRDHLVSNECGHVPPEVQASVAHRHARSFSEAEFVRLVVKRFREAGWRCFHAERGKGRDGRWMTNTADIGLPDWIFLRPPELLIIEFKTEQGRATPDQVAVVSDLQGVTRTRAFFARPHNFERLAQLADGA